MKKVIVSFMLGAITAYFAAVQVLGTMTQKDINNEMLNALVWTQTSAEYRSLCYQAYNVALEQVRKSTESFKSGDKPLAIILDCDETVIDNIQPDALLIDNNISGTDIFYAWMQDGKPDAMPGAEEFLNSVNSLGVNIFYVTNRREQYRVPTMDSLKALNFPQVDNYHTIFKTDENSKDSRFRKIEGEYDVILYLGDSAHDFPTGIYGKNMQERNYITDSNKALYGKKYIALPNPVYGSWLGAFTENFNKMSPEEKHKAKVNALRIWKK